MISRTSIFVISTILAVSGVYAANVVSSRHSRSSTDFAKVQVTPTPFPKKKLLPRTVGPGDDNFEGNTGAFSDQGAASDGSSEQSSAAPSNDSNLVPDVRRTPGTPPAPTISPLIDSLRTLQNAQPAATADPRFLFGAGTGSGASGLNNNMTTAGLTPTATPVASPSTTPAFPRVAGQPTGYDMLYLMQPEARATVEKQIEIMLDAQVNDLYLGVLVDGTFSIDYPYLRDVVQRLNGDGRTLTLVLYFSNGPAMRNQTPPFSGFNIILPNTFRDLIEHDSHTELTFQGMVSNANSTYDLNSSLNSGNRNFAIVMLEDNLDYDSYVAMRQLAQTALAGRAQTVRNPCLNCYPGNNANPVGDLIESHNPADIGSTEVDGFSLDGVSYAFPGESIGFSINGVKQLKIESIADGVQYFGLWRAARQGLGDTSIAPSDRTYEVPSDAQKTIEMDLLRTGLNTVTADEPTPADDQ